MGAQVGILSGCQFASLDGLAYTGSGRNLKTWWNFEDFIEGAVPTNAIFGIYTAYYSGAAALVGDTFSLSTRPGIVQLETGTTNVGIATLITGRNGLAPILFGAGQYTFEADLCIPTLSTVAEEYIIRIGFGDTFTGADFVDGAYFEYDRLTNGDVLMFCTANNSARTKNSMGWIAAGVWIRLKIIVNQAGTAVDFYVNNGYVGRNVLNIPTGAGRGTAINAHIIKSAGATTRMLQLDWIWAHFDLTASR